MPPNAVYVGRPTIFGNPFGHGGRYSNDAVADYRLWLGPGGENLFPSLVWERHWLLNALPRLRGKDLCCWCPLDQPCHADVLLEIANR